MKLALFLLLCWPSFNFLAAQDTTTLVISYKYMVGCETGAEDCSPQLLLRAAQEPLVLEMPCGGTLSTIYILGDMETEEPIALDYTFVAAQCPPRIDLTHLEDGQYHVQMTSCGLGGGFQLTILTKEK